MNNLKWCNFGVLCSDWISFCWYVIWSFFFYMLLCSPRVEFCGYSVPHPSENRVNLRIQTTGSLPIRWEWGIHLIAKAPFLGLEKKGNTFWSFFTLFFELFHRVSCSFPLMPVVILLKGWQCSQMHSSP